MTSVSLPSTLVKCLYLFFDLPEMADPDSTVEGSQFTARERRILLQRIFVQVCLLKRRENFSYNLNDNEKSVHAFI